MMTPEEDLEWAKKYWERGELGQAMSSMMMDLNKHPELEKHPRKAIA